MPHRPTRDIDLSGWGNSNAPELAQILREICLHPVEPDGITFSVGSISAEVIREAELYEGVRVRLKANLGRARIDLVVDVGFGDAIVPVPKEAELPGLLDFPAPRLRVYPPEAVIAEKLQAAVTLGLVNSRMKDFYDLWTLSQKMEFSGTTLAAAIRATFARRGTSLPLEEPVALTPAFYEDGLKQRQWQGFLRRERLQDRPLAEVIERLRDFLLPPLVAVAEERSFSQCWEPGGPWQTVLDARTHPEQP